jgi:hypothetical protein
MIRALVLYLRLTQKKIVHERAFYADFMYIIIIITTTWFLLFFFFVCLPQCPFFSWPLMFFMITTYFIANTCSLWITSKKKIRRKIHNQFKIFFCLRQFFSEKWMRYILVKDNHQTFWILFKKNRYLSVH